MIDYKKFAKTKKETKNFEKKILAKNSKNFEKKIFYQTLLKILKKLKWKLWKKNILTKIAENFLKSGNLTLIHVQNLYLKKNSRIFKKLKKKSFLTRNSRFAQKPPKNLKYIIFNKEKYAFI